MGPGRGADKAHLGRAAKRSGLIVGFHEEDFFFSPLCRGSCPRRAVRARARRGFCSKSCACGAAKRRVRLEAVGIEALDARLALARVTTRPASRRTLRCWEIAGALISNSSNKLTRGALALGEGVPRFGGGWDRQWRQGSAYGKQLKECLIKQGLNQRIDHRLWRLEFRLELLGRVRASKSGRVGSSPRSPNPSPA